ncbi:hypothetical protein [Sulfurimonas sp.]|uniref:hypothetical protein n=1 Tax=Sulfurimonas sp. TaxID=2022749 RepID=UPI003568A720
MKVLIFLLLTIFTLNADTKQNTMLDSFKQNISAANAVVKRGNYHRYDEYRNGIESTIDHVQKLDISQKEKQALQEDLQTYAKIINGLYKKLHTKAPNFKKHYKNSAYNQYSFDKKISSIGYRPIIRAWYRLNKIKNRYVKKPDEELEKNFYKNWKIIVDNITELYLDEEIEEPLFAYLDEYKMYFDEISIAYKSVEYENIKRLKPLSYKIKAKMEFLNPIKL